MRLNADFNVEVKLDSLEGLVANFYATNRRIQKEVKELVGDIASKIHQRTVDLCPKDTFYMSEHVRTDFSDQGYTFEVGWDAADFLGTFDAKGRPRAFYPFFVEFGTKKMRAQPSLSLAWKEVTPEFSGRLNTILSRATQS
jgi:HK97 gp10 family phage protein